MAPFSKHSFGGPLHYNQYKEVAQSTFKTDVNYRIQMPWIPFPMPFDQLQSPLHQSKSTLIKSQNSASRAAERFCPEGVRCPGSCPGKALQNDGFMKTGNTKIYFKVLKTSIPHHSKVILATGPSSHSLELQAPVSSHVGTQCHQQLGQHPA